MSPKASAPELVQQQAQNDAPFDIEGNFKRGIGEKIDQYYEDQYQKQPQVEIDAGDAGGGSAGQYGAQAPAPFEDMPAYKPSPRAAREETELGEFSGNFASPAYKDFGQSSSDTVKPDNAFQIMAKELPRWTAGSETKDLRAGLDWVLR